MNHIYRLVWNHAQNTWMAVAETARGRGKRSQRSLLTAALTLAAAAAVQAAPNGGQVVSGAGSISQTGTTTTVVQSSPNLALTWKSFNVGTQETVNFRQPSASAIAVNRITDTNGSQILGRVNANGQVWLINPNGILFGQGAQVNVGGLVASTLDVNDGAGSGAVKFSGSGNGSVINQGTITSAQGGYVALLGNQVSNTGTISAPQGTVALGAGSAVTLTFEGDSLTRIQVDQSVLNSLAENGGLIQADGGRVLLSAGAKDALLASVVNNTGIIEARTVENHEGTIVLLGGMQAGTVNAGGTLDASAPGTGNGGTIETSAAHVNVKDGAHITMAAAQGQAGSLLIDPTDFLVAPSGGNTTGTMLSSILASGSLSVLAGNGASIYVNDSVSWASHTLTLNAQNNIIFNAPLNGSGTASLSLYYGQGAAATGNTSTYTVNAAINLPAGSHFSTTQGLGGVTKNYTVITSLGAPGSTTNTDLQGISGLSQNYALGADIDASATAGWNINQGFKPISYFMNGVFDGLGHRIDSLTINRGTTSNVGLFAYTSGATIQNIGLTNANISGNTYVGALIGNGETTAINNAYSTGTVNGDTGVGGLVGTFGVYGGSISNSHSDATVSGVFGVGGLAGENGGTITKSFATGNVTGTGNAVGGLAGFNDAAAVLTNTYATGLVTGSSDYVGGLIGFNYGTINGSYATGNVTGRQFVGGLVGENDLAIGTSYATGSVTGNSVVGGLAGNGYGKIETSYAAGRVTGNAETGGLVGRGSLNSGTQSYWDVSTTGQATSVGGGTGIATTAAMQTQGTYSGDWDFANTWVMYEGHTYPLLRAFMTPLTATAASTTRTYTGSTSTVGVSYSSTPNPSHLFGTVSAVVGRNVGTYTVTPTGLYSDQQGYIITTQSGTVNVTPASLTLSTANVSKIYDGNTSAQGTAVTAGGTSLLGTDSLAGGSFAFTDKNVGAGNKTVTVSGVTVNDGNGGKNYTVSYANNTTSTISPATLTVNGLLVSDKVYDGTTSAQIANTGSVTPLAGDSVTLGTSLTAAFLDKNVGNGKSVSITGYTLSGADAGNYTLVAPGAFSASITPASLTISTSNVTKTYDTKTSASGSAVAAGGTTLFGTDSLSGGSFAFTDKNVGAGNKTVTVSGVTVNDGNGGKNYTVSYANNTTSTISPAALTVNGLTVSDKVYDGTTSAQIASAGSVTPLAGDSVTLGSSLTAAFLDKNVGKNKIVSVTGYALTGADAGNYILVAPEALSASITPANLLVSSSNVTKTYDGNTSAIGTPVVSGGTTTLFGSDSLSGGSFAFTDKNVGAGNKTVTVSGVTVNDGNGGKNYTVSYTSNTSSTINPASLIVSGVEVSNKTYDGTTVATLSGTPTVEPLAGDKVSLGSSLTATFVDKNVGNGKGVNVSGYTLSGADAGNYVLVTPEALSANITPASLTVSSANVNKTYDGTTAAAGSAVVLGGTLFAGDALSGGSYAFTDKNVGSGKTVTVSGVTVNDGNGGNNYVLTTVNNTQSSITPASLSLTASNVNKTYDGTTAATGSVLVASGTVFSGDTLSGGSLAFADKRVGSGKTVNVSGVTLNDGNNGNNYDLHYVANTASTITPAHLALSGVSANDKVYDGTVVATLTGSASVTALKGDSVTVSGSASGVFADKNVGNGKAVTVSGFTLSGADAANYTLDPLSGVSANITPATLSYVATPVSLVVGQTPGILTGSFSGFVAGDSLANATTGTALWTSPVSASSQPGHYAITGSGLSATNYVLAQASGNATALTLNPGSVPQTVESLIPQLLVTPPNTVPRGGVPAPTPGQLADAIDPEALIEANPTASGGVISIHQTDELPDVAYEGVIAVRVVGTGVRLPANNATAKP